MIHVDLAFRRWINSHEAAYRMLRVARVDAAKNRTVARHPRIRTLFESMYNMCMLHHVIEEEPLERS